MKCNVGRTEQIVRIVIGVVEVLLGLYFRSWREIIGLAPIITGSIGYYPVSDFLPFLNLSYPSIPISSTYFANFMNAKFAQI